MKSERSMLIFEVSKTLYIFYSIKTRLTLAVCCPISHRPNMPNHSAFLGWRTFNGKIEQIQHLCQNNSGKLTPSPESIALLQALHQSLQAQMTDASGNFSLPTSTQRHITELHRLLRLSLTDAALCQAARSEVLQTQRFGQFCDRLSQLRQHAEAILAAPSAP
jgi:hypothetical protein